jgi:hypothetical protein
MMRPVLAFVLVVCLGAAPELVPCATAETSPNKPPHSWLFGSWTGGLFPTPTGLTAEACLSQPVVIFTTDVVLRANLLDSTYDQRVVETARTTKAGAVEFHFAPARGQLPADRLLGITNSSPKPGFGCESPDVLHVQLQSDNEIVFPGCSDFPSPLTRCPNR